MEGLHQEWFNMCVYRQSHHIKMWRPEILKLPKKEIQPIFFYPLVCVLFSFSGPMESRIIRTMFFFYKYDGFCGYKTTLLCYSSWRWCGGHGQHSENWLNVLILCVFFLFFRWAPDWRRQQRRYVGQRLPAAWTWAVMMLLVCVWCYHTREVNWDTLYLLPLREQFKWYFAFVVVIFQELTLKVPPCKPTEPGTHLISNVQIWHLYKNARNVSMNKSELKI